ncbi:hypothetical protein [Polynucleobacter necessarius]|uniref:hypothetical protein n=1 Tax=Polynucleobacter necessarius TaxID=576610 RepID=UPI0013B066A9|nr:hypothetical protein [Polynucleobacter necessarius]
MQSDNAAELVVCAAEINDALSADGVLGADADISDEFATTVGVKVFGDSIPTER